MKHLESSEEIVFSTTEHFHLDPAHPGITDSEYVFRRRFFHSICSSHRRAEAEPPLIHYTPEEEALWRRHFEQLEELHLAHACQEYLEGRRLLDFSGKRIPQARDVSHRLRAHTGFGLAPAEGLLHFRDFFSLVGKGRLPCTQFLRHHSSPEFTPEPDMLHDLVGHVPLLVHEPVTDSMRAIGRAAIIASEEELILLNRLYWFGIEFGLVESRDELKIYGAGILSSPGEIWHSLSKEVIKKPFTLDEVISTDYDPTTFQGTLFIVSSLEQLRDETMHLLSRLNLLHGGSV